MIYRQSRNKSDLVYFNKKNKILIKNSSDSELQDKCAISKSRYEKKGNKKMIYDRLKKFIVELDKSSSESSNCTTSSNSIKCNKNKCWSKSSTTYTSSNEKSLDSTIFKKLNEKDKYKICNESSSLSSAESSNDSDDRYQECSSSNNYQESSLSTKRHNQNSKAFESKIINNTIQLKVNKKIQDPYRFMLNIFLDTQSGFGSSSILDFLTIQNIPLNVPLYFKEKDCSWDLMGQSLMATNTEPTITNLYEHLTDVYYETLMEQENGYINISKFLEILLAKYFYIAYYQPNYGSDYNMYDSGNSPDFNSCRFFNDFMGRINIGFIGCENYEKNLRFKFVLRYEDLNIAQNREQLLRGTYNFSITIASLRKDPNKFIERPIDEKIPVFAIKLLAKNVAFKDFYAFCQKLKLNPNKQFNIYLDPGIKKEFYDVFLKGVENINKTFNKIGYMKDQFKLVTKEMKEFPKDYSPVNIKYPSITFVDAKDYLGLSDTIIDPRTGEIIWFSIHIFSPFLLLAGVESYYYLTNNSAINSFGQNITDYLINKNHEKKGTCKCCSKIEFIDPIIKMMYGYKYPREKLIEIMKKIIGNVLIHEFGHSLGLRHYFNRSFYAPTKLLADSVMDYYLRYTVDSNDPNNITIEDKNEFGSADEFVLRYIYAIIPDEKKGQRNPKLDLLAENNPILLTDENLNYELTTATWDIGNNSEKFLNELHQMISSVKNNLADLFDKRIIDAKIYTNLLISNMVFVVRTYIDYITGFLRDTRIDRENRIFSFDLQYIPITIAMILRFAYFENFFPLSNQEKTSMMSDKNADYMYSNQNVDFLNYYFDRRRLDIYNIMAELYFKLYYSISNEISALYLTYLANSQIIFEDLRSEDLIISIFDSILFGIPDSNESNQLQPFYDIYLMEKFIKTQDENILTDINVYYQKIYDSGEFVKFVLWRNTVLYSFAATINNKNFFNYPFIYNYTNDIFSRIYNTLSTFIKLDNNYLVRAITINAVLLDLKKLHNYTEFTYLNKPSTVGYPTKGTTRPNNAFEYNLNTFAQLKNENEFNKITKKYVDRFNFFKF